jgi:hypothetical protein
VTTPPLARLSSYGWTESLNAALRIQTICLFRQHAMTSGFWLTVRLSFGRHGFAGL